MVTYLDSSMDMIIFHQKKKRRRNSIRIFSHRIHLDFLEEFFIWISEEQGSRWGWSFFEVTPLIDHFLVSGFVGLVWKNESEHAGIIPEGLGRKGVWLRLRSWWFNQEVYWVLSICSWCCCWSPSMREWRSWGHQTWRRECIHLCWDI